MPSAFFKRLYAAIQELDDGASSTPEIDLLVVFSVEKDDLWRSIEASDDVGAEAPLPLLPGWPILGQSFQNTLLIITEDLRMREIDDASGETKITELDLAVLLKEDVPWLDVSVHDPCAVDELQGAEDAVEALGHVLLRDQEVIR